jgi:hypothetical protein
VPAQQDPFDEFPNWPTTPAHIRLPRPVEENPLREFPNYPNTPAHIKVPILVEENPLREFPNYPNTPAHIKVPTLVEGNPLRDFPNYPNTPAHITAPTPVEENPLREFPNYPNTPAHITAPTPVEENPLREFPNYPNTPAHIQMPTLVEFAEDPIAASTPTQYTEDVSMEDVMDEPIGESVCLPPPVQHASVAMLVPEAKQVVFAPSVLPILAPAALGSPIKSAMRSPQKESPQKKSVTFNAHPYSAFDSSLLITDGPLSGTIFYVDVQSNGKAQNHLFVGLLEDLGAQVIANWNSDYIGLTHVLFKDGSPATLQKVKATNGAVKCVNIGWAIDCEKNNKRMDEADYAVNLNQAPVPISTPAPKRIAWTPARTPSQFFNFQTPSSVPATPPTPNSSEWERSLTIDDLNDKENKDPSPISKPIQQTCPAKPQSLVASILRQSPIKFSLAPKTVARPMKRKLETFGGISMAPPKKPRFL